MATKKARKGAVKVADRRRLPRVGDVVWVEKFNVLGIFEYYGGPLRKYLRLSWPAAGFTSYAWPSRPRVLHGVEKKDIRVLHPDEILVKVDWMMRVRDEKLREKLRQKISEVSSISFREVPLLDEY